MYKLLRLRGDCITQEFKQYKNSLTNDLRIAEKSYYSEKLENEKHNLSKTWKILHTIISSRKSLRQTIKLNNNGKLLTKESEIANYFNNYFLSAPKNLCKNLPPSTKDPCSCIENKNQHSIFLKPPTEEEILKIISQFKSSSPGHDNIGMQVIKSVKHELVSLITYLCRLSLEAGKMPDQLKIARVNPIFKKGDKTRVNNYRPVSVLSAFSKNL